MSKVAHTPGPWRVDVENETGTPTISIRDGLNQQIATVNPYRLAWRDADSRLIAAAPCMFEALELLHYRLTEGLSSDEYSIDAIDYELKECFKALAKARGE